jgi:hypothetical protein
MTAAQIRDMSWATVRRHLVGPRVTVYEWLLANGPATTMAIAAGTRINLLTVRPRVTELCHMGLAALAGDCRRRNHEGIYAAIPMTQAEAKRAAPAPAPQTQLALRLGA